MFLRGDHTDRRESGFETLSLFNRSLALRWMAISVSSSLMRRFAATSSSFSADVSPGSLPSSILA
ncbi:MAG: hypothetical protein ACJAYU_002773 [Bradymonadia bacterium]|jgi:hypothetical protein